MPTVPVSAAGWRMDPPGSVAVAARQRAAATAGGAAPEEAPGTRLSNLPLRRHGEITGPKALVSLEEPMANSSQLSLPSMTPPAFHRLTPTADSYVGLKSSRILEQAVVRALSVQKRSLLPSGRPSSGRALPSFRRLSLSFACLSASSGVGST